MRNARSNRQQCGGGLYGSRKHCKTSYSYIRSFQHHYNRKTDINDIKQHSQHAYYNSRNGYTFAAAAELFALTQPYRAANQTGQENTYQRQYEPYDTDGIGLLRHGRRRCVGGRRRLRAISTPPPRRLRCSQALRDARGVYAKRAIL